MYKGEQFHAKDLEAVKEDVRTAREIFGAAETVFLGDSDNLVHKDLPEIAAFIREVFLEARRITTYARAKTVVKRSEDWLRSVRDAGLSRLHLGLESGDPVVLERLCKGSDPEEMVLAGRKARKAGFEVSFYVLSGAGGTDRWREHALESARVLNQAKPDFIRLRTLTVQNGTPLDHALSSGDFAITPPLDRLREVRLLVEHLDLIDCFLASDHLTNYLWQGDRVVYRGVAGDLPEDKERMLRVLDKAISRIQASDSNVKDANALYREGIITAL
jgi:radical SAM superfamily enzyme YgiQ (UPF0313 family)